MKNAQLINQIVTSLTESLAVLEKAARASHEEATHESSKAESKYDTLRVCRTNLVESADCRVQPHDLNSMMMLRLLLGRTSSSVRGLL
jgi:hypothetical protein